MDDDLDEVQQYPSALFVTGLSETWKVGLFGVGANLVGDGSPLSRARACGDDKVVGDRALAGQVKYGYVFAVPLAGNLSGGYRKGPIAGFFFFRQISSLLEPLRGAVFSPGFRVKPGMTRSTRRGAKNRPSLSAGPIGYTH